MALDSEQIVRLAKEVHAGVSAERSEFPDTEEVRDARTRLKQELADIEARGHAVDLPHEFPEVTRITPVRS